ncbi:sterol desaturase family protein [Flavobacteriaceae bacterium]|nr:sterol desaturase family protein [Flavobacteriaceae bacterium]
MNLLSVLLFVQKFNVNHDNMNTYASILLWVVPGFMVLMTVEALYGHFTNKQTYSFMDTLSSLSSGITNVLKDSLGLVLVILSYPYILDTIAVFDLESSVMLYVVAFICIDFASYWNHRLNHKVNIFWNRHVIHHSSEEFNLACALRQSISAWIGFGAFFLIPAAFFGVPAQLITLLAPIHLFAQFWYHTQHIGKLGFLEYIIVTPSQHRVHHAINPIYIDKNLSAIFCIWDRAFGTFQEELDEEPPVYGVLKPVNTWNPLLINFQHAFNVIQDAYNTSSFKDKLRIWFMPTGWRPNDVVEKFPRNIIKDHNNREKYSPNYSNFMKFTAIFHFISINFLLYFFLSNISIIETDLRLIFGLIIFISVFGFTSLLDLQSWAPFFEVIRSISTILILYSINDYSLFVNYPTEFSLIIAYFILSSLISFIIIFNKNHYLIKFSNATS